MTAEQVLVRGMQCAQQSVLRCLAILTRICQEAPLSEPCDDRDWLAATDAADSYGTLRKQNRRQRSKREQPQRVAGRARQARPPHGGPTRQSRQGSATFRCRHCRAVIGPTLSGGRHRNHCPLCLHSRHVDRRRPGDRGSNCGSLMAPVERFDRPNGEPVVVHRCRGCGVERHNRLAADDNVLVLMALPLLPPRLGWRELLAEGESPDDGRLPEPQRRSS